MKLVTPTALALTLASSLLAAFPAAAQSNEDLLKELDKYDEEGKKIK